ncbi:MAG: TIR domain-containing protein [Hyphomonadaceae bacterium]|nr:TIR domain-containing protein [Hyphomonadaceae bacterium]
MSYAAEDAAAARRLVQRMKGVIAPNGQRLTGVSLATEMTPHALSQALAEADWLIVCCSPAAFASERVNAEIDEYLRLNAGSRLLLVLLRGDPRESLPARVRGREPLAADFRSVGDGQELGALKVAAVLLGAEPGALIDARAGAQRIGASAAWFMIAALALATMGASVFAAHSARQRDSAETLARDALDVAADAVVQADDLSLRLAELDRASPDVLGAAEARFERLFEQGGDAPALMRQRAHLLVRFADIHERRGDRERSGERARAAVVAFDALPESERQTLAFVRALSLASSGADGEQALAYAQRAVDAARTVREEDVRLRNAALAQALGRLGELQQAAGRRSEALALYAEAAPALEAVLEHSPPGDEAAIQGLAGALRRLGDAQVEAGDLDGARVSYTRTVALARARLDLDPRSAAARAELGSALSKLGRAFVDAGNPAAAVEALQESLALARQQAAAAPDDAAAQTLFTERLIYTARMLGGVGRAGPALMEEALTAARADLDRRATPETRTALSDLLAVDAVRLQRARNYADARTAWREVVQLRRTLARGAPSASVAEAQEQIGATSLALNELPAATAAYAESVRQHRGVLAAAQNDRTAQAALAEALHRLAQARLREENEASARGAFAEAARLRLALAQSDPADAAIAYAAADSLNRLAQTQLEASPARARENLETARELLSRIAEAHPTERRYATALRRTNAALSQLPSEGAQQ